jgi:hypothetical protein
VDEALRVPPLQRLAHARVAEMEVRETDDALEARAAPPRPAAASHSGHAGVE